MTDMEKNVIWPKVFTDPDFEYADNPEHPNHKAVQACADGLEGWSLCVMGKQPATFGEGMVKVAKAAGCQAIPEKLSARATELGF